MRQQLIYLFFTLALSANAQFYKDAKYPNFSMSGGASYIGESKDFAGHIRFCLPTGNGMNMYYQNTYAFPTSANYKEYRFEFAWELTFLKLNDVSFFAVGGYNFGYWQMQKAIDNSYNYTIRHKDNSLFYGGGVNYDFNKKITLYSAYKVYPSIFCSYAELGLKYNYYYNKQKARKRGRVVSPNKR